MNEVILITYFFVIFNLFLGIHLIPYFITFSLVQSSLKTRIMIPTYIVSIIVPVLVFINLSPLIGQIYKNSYLPYESGTITFQESALKMKGIAIKYIAPDVFDYILFHIWKAFEWSLYFFVLGLILSLLIKGKNFKKTLKSLN